MRSLLTVLIPTLNAADFLEEALDSLAAQTMRDFRILVLDGGSEDKTRQITLSRDGIGFVPCGPIGLGAQLRIGLEKANTPFIARMDADDISLPRRFEMQIEALANPEIAIVGTQIDLLIGSTVCAAQPLPRAHSHIRRALLAGFPAFCHPSVMFRTTAARRVHAYAISGVGEDLDFFLRMTEAGAGSNLGSVLYRYRLHDRSVSFTSFEEVRRNYAFALACANARREGRPEPDPAAYALAWARRSWGSRLATRIECYGVRLYRRSRIRLAQGQRLKGLAGAAFSVAVRPALIRTRTRIALAAFARGEST